MTTQGLWLTLLVVAGVVIGGGLFVLVALSQVGALP